MLSSSCYIRGEFHVTPTVREGVSLASRKTTNPQDKAPTTVGKVAARRSASKDAEGTSPLTKAVAARVRAAAQDVKSALAAKVKSPAGTKAKAAAGKSKTTATASKKTTASAAAAKTKAAAKPKSAAATKSSAKGGAAAAAKAKTPSTTKTKATAASKTRAATAEKTKAASSKAGSSKARATKGTQAEEKDPSGVSPAKERKKKLVPDAGPEHEAALAAARVAADAAVDKKAEDVLILDVAGLNSYADCFVIASGSSDRQVSAIADAIEEKMKKAGHKVIGVEGHGLGHWILLDYADVVVHVFYEEVRAHYDVEGLWSDAKRIQVG